MVLVYIESWDRPHTCPNNLICYVIEKVSIREAVKSVSLGLSQGFIRCNCNGKCITNRCSCKEANLSCNTKCHPTSSKCENIEDKSKNQVDEQHSSEPVLDEPVTTETNQHEETVSESEEEEPVVTKKSLLRSKNKGTGKNKNKSKRN